MATITEPNTLGDGIKWEEGGSYSREKIVVASGNSVACLEVVGKITLGGKCVPLAPAAVDGSEAAAGIMVAAIDATTADQAGVVVNDHAMAAMDNLVWPDGISAGEKTTAIAELEALGIKAVGLA
ncbi:MAG: hypothetical protein ACI8PB_002896 [Desulforhopalus sp.]|jgi:hypothetical protein